MSFKEEVKNFYESGFYKTRDVVKRFSGLNMRTLQYWIANEGWERGRLVKEAEAIIKERERGRLGSVRLELEEEVKRELLADTAVNEALRYTELSKVVKTALLKSVGQEEVKADFAFAITLTKEAILKARENEDEKTLSALLPKLAGMLKDFSGVAFGTNLNVKMSSDLERLSEAELSELLLQLSEEE